MIFKCFVHSFKMICCQFYSALLYGATWHRDTMMEIRFIGIFGNIYGNAAVRLFSTRRILPLSCNCSQNHTESSTIGYHSLSDFIQCCQKLRFVFHYTNRLSMVLQFLMNLDNCSFISNHRWVLDYTSIILKTT